MTFNWKKSKKSLQAYLLLDGPSLVSVELVLLKLNFLFVSSFFSLQTNTLFK